LIWIFSSGFILANGLLGKLQKTGGKFRFINYLANRWIRFSIPLLGSILFFYLLPLLGSGPIWDYGVNWVIRGCESPLVVLFGFLYISNFNEQFEIMPRQEAVPFVSLSKYFIVECANILHRHSNILKEKTNLFWRSSFHDIWFILRQH